MTFEKFFRNSSINDTRFFDEGPRIEKQSIIVNSSSIETSTIDGYRQGVEITQQKHFDAGIVKIHAGEPGHRFLQLQFGQDRNYDLFEENNSAFIDFDRFDSVSYLKGQISGSNQFKFPVVVNDTDNFEGKPLNGVLEPLTIRRSAAMMSLDVPFEAHSIKGEFQAGNSNITLASDQILTVYDINDNDQIPFLDGYFFVETSRIKPFSDQRQTFSNENEFQSALSLMSGSTENYISNNKRSATCGWSFHANVVGTDSIAFGGQLY